MATLENAKIFAAKRSKETKLPYVAIRANNGQWMTNPLSNVDSYYPKTAQRFIFVDGEELIAKPIIISGTEFVSIKIPRKSYEFLAKWASVSRTLTRSKEYLEELACMKDLNEESIEDVNFNLEELSSLIYHLDQVSQMCTSAKIETELEELEKTQKA